MRSLYLTCVAVIIVYSYFWLMGNLAVITTWYQPLATNLGASQGLALVTVVFALAFEVLVLCWPFIKQDSEEPL